MKFMNLKVEVFPNTSMIGKRVVRVDRGGPMNDIELVVDSSLLSEYVEPPLDLVNLPVGAVVKNTEKNPTKWVKTVKNTFVCFASNNPCYIGEVFEMRNMLASELELDK